MRKFTYLTGTVWIKQQRTIKMIIRMPHNTEPVIQISLEMSSGFLVVDILGVLDETDVEVGVPLDSTVYVEG